jgi:hypothetical protein
MSLTFARGTELVIISSREHRYKKLRKGQTHHLPLRRREIDCDCGREWVK